MAQEDMGPQKLTCGEVGALRVVLEWRDDYDTEGPIGKTWGDLQLWIGDTLVWGRLAPSGEINGLTWSWIDLLEFLTNAWPYLTEEEQYPITFDNRWDEPAHLGELWGKAKLRLRKLEEAQADNEDALLRDFLAVHDFAEALQGAQPAKFLLLRRGNQMLAATTRQELRLPFAATMSALEALGDAIANRLIGSTDTRSECARRGWDNRDAIASSVRLQIATGRDEQSLKRIWPLDMDSRAANEDTYELKAAARMIGHSLADEHLRAVLTVITQLPSGRRPDLGALWQRAVDLIREFEGAHPALQGYLLAAMLREHLNKESGRVDPENTLYSWGVQIRDFAMGGSSLDAIAVWHAQRAATILLNTAGPRAQHPTGRRSTLAHEICHLLVDLDGALPVVEVLGGNVPREIEQRANAFAAEFLLPRAEAAAYVQRELRFVNAPNERRAVIERCVDALVESHGASHETTAWQILRSNSVDSSDEPTLRKHLRSIHEPFELGISRI